MEPEIFDKRNAPSSPLTRGDPAPQFSSKDGTPIHKSILKYSGEENLSVKSKKSNRVSKLYTAEVYSSSPLSISAELKPRLDDSIQMQKSSETNSEEKYLPLADCDIHDGLEDVEDHNEYDLPLELEMAKPKKDNVEITNYSGMKQLLKTPMAFHQKDADLSGLSSLFDSPKTIVPKIKSPVVSKGSESPILYSGVRKLVQTPKPDPPVSYLGIKELVKTPQHASIVSLVGVKELVQTPKDGEVMSLVGLKEMVKTPKPAHITSLDGVKEFLETPSVSNKSLTAESQDKSTVSKSIKSAQAVKPRESIPSTFEKTQMPTDPEPSIPPAPTRMTRCRYKAIETQEKDKEEKEKEQDMQVLEKTVKVIYYKLIPAFKT